MHCFNTRPDVDSSELDNWSSLRRAHGDYYYALLHCLGSADGFLVHYLSNLVFWLFQAQKKNESLTTDASEELCLGKIWYQVRLRVLTGRRFQATNLVSLWQRQLPAQLQDNYIQVQWFDSTNSWWIIPACFQHPPPRHVVSALGQLGADALEQMYSPKKKKKKSWSTSRNLKVMSHVVYYNNWNGSNWKRSPEYPGR